MPISCQSSKNKGINNESFTHIGKGPINLTKKAIIT